MNNINKYADNLINFFQKEHDIQNKPAISFQKDAQNGQNPLICGKWNVKPMKKATCVLEIGKII